MYSPKDLGTGLDYDAKFWSSAIDLKTGEHMTEPVSNGLCLRPVLGPGGPNNGATMIHLYLNPAVLHEYDLRVLCYYRTEVPETTADTTPEKHFTHLVPYASGSFSTHFEFVYNEVDLRDTGHIGLASSTYMTDYRFDMIHRNAITIVDIRLKADADLDTLPAECLPLFRKLRVLATSGPDAVTASHPAITQYDDCRFSVTVVPKGDHGFLFDV
jgi:hypothetical protein